MSNLGDSNTPVEGESFGLPAGAELGEDNGELVIKDSGGSIILRRDETNAEWQFENTDLTGINSIDASSANLNDATVANSPTTNDDVVRKTETDAIQSDVDGKVEQTEFDNHSTQHEDGGTDALDLTGLSGDLADQQQPTDHSHDGTADSGGANLNPEATTLQDTQQPTTDGEIRRSGSDVFVHTNGLSRNLSDFLTASQVEIVWTKDGTLSETNTGSVTYNLSDTYDIVRVFMSFELDEDSFSDTIELQINGDTGSNYDSFRINGSQGSGLTYWNVAEGQSTDGFGVHYTSFLIQGRWNNEANYANDGLMGSNSSVQTAYGINQAVSSPLSAFTLTRNYVTNASNWKLEVWGKEI